MRPRVIFVVAHDRRGIMGRDGTLPWRLPADMVRFRALTIGKSVVMGRKTYEAIGKPLQRRRNIVLTRNATFCPDGAEIARSVDEAFEMTLADREIAVIGGAQIFNEFSPYVDSAFVTEIDADVEGDVHYAAPERAHTRRVLERHPADERNAYAMQFVRYDYAVNPDVAGGSANESNPSQ